jgi:lysozyme
MSIHLIDLSDQNAPFNWGNLSPDVSGTILKASEGETVRDKTFLPNLEKARYKGLIVGGYLFWHPQDDPQKQVDNYLARGLDFTHPLTLPPIVDVENTNSDAWVQDNQETAQANLRSTLDLLEDASGKKPWIYTYKGFWASTFGNPNFSEYPLWVASYQQAEPGMFGGWTDYTLWQFAQRGGIHSPTDGSDIDWSVFNGTVEQLANI